MVATRAALLAGIVGLVEAQLGPIPPLGERCHGCKCGDLDLRSYANREFRTTADDHGYIYMFQMCDEIPETRLPEGCRPIAGTSLPHPAVIKYKDDNRLDCSLVGSFGPCDDKDCSMTYLPASDGKPFSVTWRYQYGCENTFRIYLEDGKQTQPGEAPYNDPDDPYECYWVTTWRSLQAFGTAKPKYDAPDDGGMHWFAKLLLWAFLLFIGYLVVGTVVGVKVQGKPLNVEAVPHIHIWRQAGEAASSGFVWAKDKVKGGRAAAEEYRSVQSSDETTSLKNSGEVVDYGSGSKDDYDTL